MIPPIVHLDHCDSRLSTKHSSETFGHLVQKLNRLAPKSPLLLCGSNFTDEHWVALVNLGSNLAQHEKVLLIDATNGGRRLSNVLFGKNSGIDTPIRISENFAVCQMTDAVEEPSGWHAHFRGLRADRIILVRSLMQLKTNDWRLQSPRVRVVGICSPSDLGGKSWQEFEQNFDAHRSLGLWVVES